MRNFEFRPGKSVNLRARRPPVSATEYRRRTALILTHLGSFEGSVLYPLTWCRMEGQGHIIGSVDCAAHSRAHFTILSKSCSRKSETRWVVNALFLPHRGKLSPEWIRTGCEQGGTLTEQGKKPTGLTRRTSLLLPTPNHPPPPRWLPALVRQAQVQDSPLIFVTGILPVIYNVTLP